MNCSAASGKSLCEPLFLLECWYAGWVDNKPLGGIGTYCNAESNHGKVAISVSIGIDASKVAAGNR